MKKNLLILLAFFLISAQAIFGQIYQVSFQNPPVGGWSNYTLYDDGTNGDLVSGDGIHSTDVTVNLATTGIKWYVKEASGGAIVWPIPGNGGAPGWAITTTDNQVVKFTYDINTNSEGWLPASNVGNANDMLSAGVDFYTIIEGGGAAIIMYDNGTNGDEVAGDGIYTCTKNIAVIGTYPWNPRRLTSNRYSWGIYGRENWATNNRLSFTTTTANQDVYFYVNLNDGRTLVKLGTPLPVELISFTAQKVDNSVLLNWATATEINNYGFEIERTSFQKDGTMPVQGDWTKIGFVEGHGNSNSPKEYSYLTNLSSGLFRLKQIDTDGTFEYSDVVTVESNTNFKLSQNYPNPFNPTTTISYSIPVSLNNKGNEVTKLKIYNILGVEVATLINKKQSPGNYSVQWNGKDDFGNVMPSGVYIYRIQAGSYSMSKKMTLLK